MPEDDLRILADETEADVSLLDEARAGLEIVLLHAAPVYYGLGIPQGDGSGVVEVAGTHIGLVFDPTVYFVVAKRLAEAVDPPPVLPKSAQDHRPKHR